MLNYSTDALNVKSLFYNKPFIIYVEGQDDINFWDYLFKSKTNVEFRIEESPGGKTGLLTYMDKIVEEDAQIIVACDSDYNAILPIEKKYIHDRIVRTYGYSIENTMYCPHNINQLIKRYGRLKGGFFPDVDAWYEEFLENSRTLLVYDLANHVFTKGIQVFGDKCVKFLDNEKSSSISKVKVNKFILDISKNFESEQIEYTKTLITRSKKELRFLIKGHFLTNGVLNFIKNTIRKETSIKIPINLDSLYALMVSCVGRCDKKCKDVQFLKDQIKKSLNSIENASG